MPLTSRQQLCVAEQIKYSRLNFLKVGCEKKQNSWTHLCEWKLLLNPSWTHVCVVILIQAGQAHGLPGSPCYPTLGLLILGGPRPPAHLLLSDV